MQQSEEYQNSVLPSTCRARVSIEAATTGQWGFLTGLDGEHVGIDSFGASAPAKHVQKEFGFTKEAVLATAKRVLEKNRKIMNPCTPSTSDASDEEQVGSTASNDS